MRTQLLSLREFSILTLLIKEHVLHSTIHKNRYIDSFVSLITPQNPTPRAIVLAAFIRERHHNFAPTSSLAVLSQATGPHDSFAPNLQYPSSKTSICDDLLHRLHHREITSSLSFHASLASSCLPSYYSI